MSDRIKTVASCNAFIMTMSIYNRHVVFLDPYYLQPNTVLTLSGDIKKKDHDYSI